MSGSNVIYQLSRWATQRRIEDVEDVTEVAPALRAGGSPAPVAPGALRRGGAEPWWLRECQPALIMPTSVYVRRALTRCPRGDLRGTRRWPELNAPTRPDRGVSSL